MEALQFHLTGSGVLGAYSASYTVDPSPQPLCSLILQRSAGDLFFPVQKYIVHQFCLYHRRIDLPRAYSIDYRIDLIKQVFMFIKALQLS